MYIYIYIYIKLHEFQVSSRKRTRRRCDRAANFPRDELPRQGRLSRCSCATPFASRDFARVNQICLASNNNRIFEWITAVLVGMPEGTSC